MKDLISAVCACLLSASLVFGSAAAAPPIADVVGVTANQPLRPELVATKKVTKASIGTCTNRVGKVFTAASACRSNCTKVNNLGSKKPADFNLGNCNNWCNANCPAG